MSAFMPGARTPRSLSPITLAGAEVSHVSLMEGTSSSAGHGTAVASIIAGDSEMQRGIAPAATVLSVRVLDAQGEGDSFTVAKGIIEAVDRGDAICKSFRR